MAWKYYSGLNKSQNQKVVMWSLIFVVVGYFLSVYGS